MKRITILLNAIICIFYGCTIDSRDSVNKTELAVHNTLSSQGSSSTISMESIGLKSIVMSQLEIDKHIIKNMGMHFQTVDMTHNLRFNFYKNGDIEIFPRNSQHSISSSWRVELKVVAYGRQGDMTEVDNGDIELSDCISSDVGVNDECIRKLYVLHDEFAEWYLNTDDGVKQGFEVYSKPGGEEKLVIEMEVNGSDLFYDMSGDNIVFINHEFGFIGNEILMYRDLNVLDNYGVMVPAKMEIINGHILLVIDDDNVDYPLIIDPIFESTPWTRESDCATAEMGFSVGNAGHTNDDDYDDVIVGFPYYDGGQTNEGRFVVYRGSSTGMTTSYAFVRESDSEGALMGYSVAGAGDVDNNNYDDIVVGCPNYTNGQTNEGRVVVYLAKDDGSGLSTDDAWLRESEVTGAKMGFSVAGAGNINGDDYDDIVVGFPYYTNGQSYEGRAVVYRGSSSGPTHVNAWLYESNSADAHFGWSVAGGGNVNGDSYPDIIIGAPFYDNGESDEGAAYIFLGSSTGPLSTPHRILEIDEASARFGYSVGMGNFKGDSYGDIIIGAPRATVSELYEGKVYLYYGTSSGIPSTADLVLEGDQGYAEFGHCVANAGNVDGSYYDDAIVGAPYYSPWNCADCGGAYVFLSGSSGLNSYDSWSEFGDQENEYFGYSVSSAGDVDNSGEDDIIIGAPMYDNGQTNEGRVVVYYAY